MDYVKVLQDNNLPELWAAYDHAARIAWDRRLKQNTRNEAREFLPQLTKALRDKLESLGSIR